MASVLAHRYAFDAKKPIELDEKYATVDPTVPGMRDITLLPHQQVIVAAMLEYGRCRKITHTDGKITVSNAFVLSEPFGTGKTYEVLSTLLLMPTPAAAPEYTTCVHGITLERRNTNHRALIKPSLIVVGSSVVIQWENAIKKYTDLRVFTVAHFSHLKRFQEMVRNGAINDYDAILLKNGTVTGRLMLNGDVNVREYHSLIATVNIITGTRTWPWVFYDDFDTINMPSESAVNALATVYVSATTKPGKYARDTRTTTFEAAVRDAFKRPLTAVMRDQRLFACYNVRNKREFTEASTHVTKMNGHKYVYANPDDNYIRLIGAIGDDGAAEIMEMLNGDAPGAAADALGMKSISIADIFQRVLGNKRDEFIAASYALDSTRLALAAVNSLPPHERGKNHPMARIVKIRALLAKGELRDQEHAVRVVKYSSPTLLEALRECEAEYGAAKERSGIAIQRVMDNAREGMCQICCLPLGEELDGTDGSDVYIVKCCGIILCDQCWIRGNQMRKQFDRAAKETAVIGKCANCQAPVNPKHDLICLDRNFSLESLLAARGDEAEPLVAPPEPTPAPAADAPAEPEIKNPKLRALLAIIQGHTPEAREPMNLRIDRLLEGTMDVPPAAGNKRVVVFASYNETLQKIEGFLREYTIDYRRLGGTHREMADTVDEFRAGQFQVLLINSQQHCAGLNLEFCNHMVLFHYITNQNVIGQVAARCQRMMRTENLQLHLLCYRNEEDFIKRYGYVD